MKCENVVNPPRNPVTSSALAYFPDGHSSLSDIDRNPMNRHPEMLTRKVPSSAVWSGSEPTASDTR